MNALLLDGRTNETPFGDMVLSSLLGVLGHRGYDTEVVALREKSIHYCRGCFGCWLESPGVCVIDDDAREITKKTIRSDLVIYFTPITFGGYSNILKQQVDRSIGLVHPFFDKVGDEHHHRKRYRRYPCMLGVGLLEVLQKDLEDLFRMHVQRNALNFHSPSTGAAVVSSEQQPEEIPRVLDFELSGIEVSL